MSGQSDEASLSERSLQKALALEKNISKRFGNTSKTLSDSDHFGGCSTRFNVPIRSMSRKSLFENGSVKKNPWASHRKIIDNSVDDELEKNVTIEEIDEILDRFDPKNESAIIQQYKPQPMWIWRQWYGTLFCTVWAKVVINMLWAGAFCVIMQYVTARDFRVWEYPDVEGEPFLAHLATVDRVWTTYMSLVTLLLAFFVNQAYSFWQASIDRSRELQAAINNTISMITAYASRDAETGRYTPEARKWLEESAQKLRMFHILFWASKNRDFRCLLTRKGWNRMVDRGFVSEEERERIIKLNKVAPEKRYIPMMQGAFLRIMSGLHQGCINQHMVGNIELVLVDELKGMGKKASDVADGTKTRVPLAYVHFVQVLVDTFVLSTPFAKFGEYGILCVGLTFQLTLFFQGLVILAKVLYDPYDEEDFSEGCMYFDVAVLIREVNEYTQDCIDGSELSM